MKISISYPPLESIKGTPLLGQNRQFQWFNSPTYVYPVIPACAATLLKNNGHEVIWDDGIAEGLSYTDWRNRLFESKPNVMMIETKMPVVKRHWRIINDIKDNADWYLKIVLVGDHVTAMPEESLRYSKVDYVLSGGDYDFGLLNLVTFLSSHSSFPAQIVAHPLGESSSSPQTPQGGIGEKLSPQAGANKVLGKSLFQKNVNRVSLEPGWYWRTGGVWNTTSKNEKINWTEGEFTNFQSKNTGVMQDYHLHDLYKLPMIDRELTKWKHYAYKNGNFKYTPGSYMMSGRDCWWGRCEFCSWTTLFPGQNFRTRSVKLALDEIGHLIDLGVKEIMEDSGTLPIGDWLSEFCAGMVDRGYNKKVTMSCNMRINGIKDPKIWQMMKRAGFRFILFGLESANQKTLDSINKNLKVEEIGPGLKMCKDAGLEPHITTMIGYPWESYDDAKRTVDLAKDLFKKGYVDTLQATILIPYKGTPLYKYCEENGLLNFEDYDRFDQREQVMKCPLTTEQVKELTSGLYKAFMTPKFMIKKVLSIRNLDDIKFLSRAGFKVLGHLMDFRK